MHTALFLFLALAAGSASAQVKISIPNASNPEPGDIVVNANGETRSLTCQKSSVFVRADKGNYKIDGICKSVHILGNGNTVYVEDAARIITEGNGNTVSYRNPNIGVSTPGNGNHISVARTDQ